MAELGQDEAAIRGVVSDYVDGWCDGDGARMERALHPELVKGRRGTEGENPRSPICQPSQRQA
jgi:Putative lumazine-binding